MFKEAEEFGICRKYASFQFLAVEIPDNCKGPVTWNCSLINRGALESGRRATQTNAANQRSLLWELRPP